MTAVDPTLPLALLLAHLIGDFLLQPSSWIVDRQQHGVRSRRLMQHALLHALLALAALWLLTDTGIAALPVAAMLGASHWLIDLGKVHLEKRRPSRPLLAFLVDQLLHLVVIGVLWLILASSLAPLQQGLALVTSSDTLCVVIAYLIVTRPMSIMIAMLMKPMAEQLQDPGTLSAAGARIGIVERLLVLSLTLLDQLTAVGFVLTAKSVLRYGDLKKNPDRKLTEYVLLGTLTSVASTLLLGLVIRQVMSLA
ncbi:DUF3307 domain-containing protein [Halomonas huangheensis]|uniref:DUF3307 domain-containing protein n=1 Tax=Halomonas huangheensis TaxID=1178482 RepID=W1N3B1_9GAMM|nr:DUF3307 domain-containing protein [Halomonas huangheensis]ALM52223.1 hypothetical protein AR456_07945 [Halomonas huangheensis]ERL49445.1 hypothetical protein BJB45_06605 [Halomonas huangheensis]